MLRISRFALAAFAFIGLAGMIAGSIQAAKAASSDCVWQASRKYDPNTGGYIYRDDGGCPNTSCDNATNCVAYIVIIGLNRRACECGDGSAAVQCELWYNGPDLGVGTCGCNNRNCTFPCSMQEGEPDINGWHDIWCWC